MRCSRGILRSPLAVRLRLFRAVVCEEGVGEVLDLVREVVRKGEMIRWRAGDVDVVLVFGEDVVFEVDDFAVVDEEEEDVAAFLAAPHARSLPNASFILFMSFCP